MVFDSKQYDNDFIKKVHPTGKLPADLWARYGIEESMRSDADIAAQLAAVRSYWRMKSRNASNRAFVCERCLVEDQKLALSSPNMETRAFWDEQRTAQSEHEEDEVSALAAELEREFGAFGVITAAVLEERAEAFGANRANATAAAKKAGLDVRPAVQLPTTPPIGGAQYTALDRALVMAGARSVADLVHRGISDYSLINGFRAPDASKRLDRDAVQRLKDEFEKRDGRQSENTATTDATRILLDAVDSKVDLAKIDLYRVVQSLGPYRSAPLSRKVSLLAEAGIEAREAVQIALSLPGAIRDNAGRVSELLEAGQLREARRSLASMGDDDRSSLEPIVAQAEQQVARMREDAKAAGAGGDEGRAIELLEQAAKLAADDEAIELDLRRSALPPPVNVRVDCDVAKVKVFWAAAQRHGDDTRYVVRRKATAAMDVRDGDKVYEGEGTSIVDDSPPVGRQVVYSVFAVNGAGVASRPAVANITVLPPPYQLVSEVGADWINLTWQDHVAAESVHAFRVTDSRQVELTVVGNAIRLTGLTEGAPVAISLVARYRGADGRLVDSASVTTTLVPRGEARPVVSLMVTNLESNSGCRVRVGWQPVDHSQVIIRYADSPPSWEFGTVVTPEQMASFGVEASGSLVTQGVRIGFETAVPEGIWYFTPFSHGGTGIVVGRSRGIGTSLPVGNLAVERANGAASVTWAWPAMARVAQVAVTQDGTTSTQLVDKEHYQAHGCRVSASAGPLHIEVRAAVPVDGELSLSGAAAIDLEGEAAQVAYSVSIKRRGPGRLTLRALESPTQLGVVLVAQPGKVLPFSADDGTPLVTQTIDLRESSEETIEFEVPSWLRKPYCLKAFVAQGTAVLRHPPSSDLKVS